MPSTASVEKKSDSTVITYTLPPFLLMPVVSSPLPLVQMKILTTAVFSMLIMQKRYHARKWRALVLLVLGVTLVSNGSNVASSEDEGDKRHLNSSYMLGVAAVVTEVSQQH